MKKNLKLYAFAACIALPLLLFSACSDDDEQDGEITPREEALTPVVENYVNNIVIATYKHLADATLDLHGKIIDLQKNRTDDNVANAAKAWKDSREHWELSEAFLFGAVDEFGIDPHIDTWPLDEVEFKNLLADTKKMEKLAAEDGDVWASQYLGVSLLGFHGIENILFQDGKVKKASEITENEMIYAVAIGGDLRNQCVRLEAAWADRSDGCSRCSLTWSWSIHLGEKCR